MIGLVEIQAAYYMVAATGVLIAAAYYVMNIRTTQRSQKHTLETRQAQLYMQLYSFYDNKEFLKDYGNISYRTFIDADDWWSRYSPDKDIEAYSSWLRVGRFLDGVGILLERNLIERPLIYELLGDVIQGSWEGVSEETGMGRWLPGTRIKYNRPYLWKHFENLYHDYMRWLKEKRN